MNFRELRGNEDDKEVVLRIRIYPGVGDTNHTEAGTGGRNLPDHGGDGLLSARWRRPCDLGWIDKIPVLDVVQEEGEILHKVEHLPEKEEVSAVWIGIEDSTICDHSGQHLLSAMCLEVCQAETLSFHLGQDYATIDISRSELSQAQLMMLELEVNDQVYLNRKVTNYFVSREQVALPLVKRPKVTDDIRIVEIEGIEYNACGVRMSPQQVRSE